MFYKKSKNKSSGLKDKLDKVFSEFIRLRDSKKYGFEHFRCISCGQIKSYSQADCGHFYSRRYMSTRYDEDNCNAECRGCNSYDGDHLIGYQRNLIEKIGEKRFNLLAYKKNQTKQWSDFELIELINYYKKQVKEMKDEKG